MKCYCNYLLYTLDLSQTNNQESRFNLIELINQQNITLENVQSVPLLYSIFTLSPEVSRFKSTNNKSQLDHTDIHVQVLIAFND